MSSITCFVHSAYHGNVPKIYKGGTTCKFGNASQKYRDTTMSVSKISLTTYQKAPAFRLNKDHTKMNTVLVQPSNSEEFKFLLSLLERLKIKNQILHEEELEDLGLLAAMEEADRSKTVSEEEIMKIISDKL